MYIRILSRVEGNDQQSLYQIFSLFLSDIEKVVLMFTQIP